LDVARSLQTANELPIANGLLLWLDYFLRAEHDTRGCARSFLHFDQFTTDWQATIIQASASAGILLPEPDRATQADIDAFLQRNSDPATGLHDPSVDALHPWIAEAYREALRGCGGEALDVDALDTLAAAFSLAEEAFGPAAATSEQRLQVERDRRQAVEHDVTALDQKLQTRTQQRTELRERLTKRREEAQSLDEKLKTRTQQRTELRERLTKRREEAQSLRKTTELLMRWVLDQTRDTDRPASPELRAALAAIEKADPAAIPQIASTAVLLADKNVQLKAYEREQTKLSALVASAESQVTTAEQQLASTEKLLSRSVNEVATLNRELDSLRTALRRAEEDLRIERVRSEDAAVEQARLTELLAEQL
jgi:peptidoglycan hydrolase CwlO-like protein